MDSISFSHASLKFEEPSATAIQLAGLDVEEFEHTVKRVLRLRKFNSKEYCEKAVRDLVALGEIACTSGKDDFYPYFPILLSAFLEEPNLKQKENYFNRKLAIADAIRILMNGDRGVVSFFKAFAFELGNHDRDLTELKIFSMQFIINPEFSRTAFKQIFEKFNLDISRHFDFFKQLALLDHSTICDALHNIYYSTKSTDRQKEYSAKVLVALSDDPQLHNRILVHLYSKSAVKELFLKVLGQSVPPNSLMRPEKPKRLTSIEREEQRHSRMLYSKSRRERLKARIKLNLRAYRQALREARLIC